jgi:hypothetical protein
MRRATRLVGGMLLAAALGAPAYAAAPDRLGITSLGKGTLDVKAKEDSDRAAAYLSVLTAGQESVRLELAFQAASSESARLAGYKPRTVEPGATRVKVTFAGLKKLNREPVEGQLVVPSGTRPVARAVSITPAPQPSRDWASSILWMAVIAFGVLALVGMLFGRLKLLKPAPGPKWSLKSWATTLTAAGGILGTVLGAATLPEIPREIDKETLVRLNLLFGLLVVVGPFVFEAIRNPTVPATEQDAGYTGWNLTLLLACAITGGAVFGELATLGVLGWELAGPGDWGTAAVVAVIVVAFLAAYYLLVTTVWLVTTDWKDEARKETAKAAKAAAKPQHVSLVIVGTRGDGKGEPVPEHRLNVVIQNKAELRVAAPSRAAAAVAEADAVIEGARDEDLIVEPLATPRRWSLP